MHRHHMPAAMIAAIASLGFQGCATARTPSPVTDARSYIGPPTAAGITPGDLRTRLYIFADDSMRGRAAGTPDNLRGAAYIERELRKLGVEPAGENGTFFQDIAFISRTVDPASRLTAAGRTLDLVTDFIPRDNGPGMRSLDGVTAIYGGTWGAAETLIDENSAAGKLVVLSLPSGWSASRTATTARFKSAAGVAVVSIDRMSPSTRKSQLAPTIDIAAEAPLTGSPVPASLYISDAAATTLFNGTPLSSLKPGTTGQAVRGNISFIRGTASPGRNVIGVIRGSDPRFRGQYVAFGAHNDHEPPVSVALDHDSVRAYNIVVRPSGAESPAREATNEESLRIRAMLDSLRKIHPPRLDSIRNGADDDGTGSMALLEIAEAFAKSPAKPKRSLLFVWHTGEEIGLVGSQWFTNHPTVPLDSIVTQLNIDMIGRGGSADAVHDVGGKSTYGNPDFVEIVGSRKLSSELGNIVDSVNQEQPRPLAFSRVFDTPGEPHQMYCRSDHYMYARHGIPITFFFTSVHADYHQITDEPQYIDYTHYSRIVKLVHDIAARVANLDHRPVVDKPKPNPLARCVA